MYNIIFVCYGNICRSPMAEMIFKDLIYSNNKRYLLSCISRATSCEELGNDIDPHAKKILKDNGVTIEKHLAKQISLSEYKDADYIIVMEEKNKIDLIKMFGDNDKIKLLLDFTEDKHNIEDPWYTAEFEKAYNEISQGCKDLFKYLVKYGDNNDK